MCEIFSHQAHDLFLKETYRLFANQIVKYLIGMQEH